MTGTLDRYGITRGPGIVSIYVDQQCTARYRRSVDRVFHGPVHARDIGIPLLEDAQCLEDVAGIGEILGAVYLQGINSLIAVFRLNDRRVDSCSLQGRVVIDRARNVFKGIGGQIDGDGHASYGHRARCRTGQSEDLPNRIGGA